MCFHILSLLGVVFSTASFSPTSSWTCSCTLTGSSAGPPSDRLLDPPSKVTPFVLTALHRTVTFRSDQARAPVWVSGGYLLSSECCCACGVARISLGIRLCVRRRCGSYFNVFLTFLKRACSPGAVKNSKIEKNMKFFDVRNTLETH